MCHKCPKLFLRHEFLERRPSEDLRSSLPLSALPVLARKGFFFALFRSWAVLGRSWVALGVLLAFLVVLGAVLDRSWIGLGRSWVALGRLLGRFLLLLGRLQAVLGHLGAILVRLGVVSGRLGELKTLIFLRFFNDFGKIEVLSKNGDLDPS